MNQDLLYDFFKKHLNALDPETQDLQDLIYEVVGDYMVHLMKQGHVPHYLLDSLETDLREEVLEIYRKVTYGFMNLKAYKEAQTRKSKSSKIS